MVLKNGNTIIMQDGYMFVTRSNVNEKFTHTYSSTFKSGFTKFVEVILPPDEKTVSHAFSIIDTKEDQVFLFLENHGSKSPFGNVYVSDSNAQYFALSLKNVIKTGVADFERVSSLDGTWIANIYDPEVDGGANEKINSEKSHGKKSVKKLFD